MKPNFEQLILELYLHEQPAQYLRQLKGMAEQKIRQYEANPSGIHNFFDFLASREYKEGQLQKAIEVKRTAWWKKRQNIIELSAKQIVGLAHFFQVSPAYIFQLILECYEKDRVGNYDFSRYNQKAEEAFQALKK